MPRHNNRSSFTASFLSRLSMSLRYRESECSEALLDILIVNCASFIVSNQRLHWIYKFFISGCGTELNNHSSLVLFRMCPTTKNTNSVSCVISNVSDHQEIQTASRVLFRMCPTTKKYRERLLYCFECVRPPRNTNSVSSGVSNHRLYP
jgi:hypothetical protein